MQSLYEAAHTVQFDTALRILAAQARTRYAGEAARIDHGLVIALNGGVTLKADGVATVQSQRDAEVHYTVNGHCDCPDAAKAPEGRCKHRWAKCLVKRAMTCTPPAVRWYATYTRPDGETVPGTATHTPHGYLFAAEDGSEYGYASGHAMVLHGRCDLVAAADPRPLWEQVSDPATYEGTYRRDLVRGR